jgi:hypothetical protein
MKKDEVPQDESNLASANIREVYYAVDEDGNYTTALSTGWEAKKIALDKSMDALEEWIDDAKEKIKAGEASPILYFMYLNKMDVPVLSGYTGYWIWRVKRHLKMKHFRNLSPKILQKYADAFEISVEELVHFKP